MITDKNPIDSVLNPSMIDRSNTTPEEVELSGGGKLFCFVDTHIDMVRIDIVLNAGTNVQDKALQAVLTSRLVTEGTRCHSAQQIAEFIDSRGIVVEKHADVMSASFTFYTLRRHVDDLLPLIYEILTQPLLGADEFEVQLAKQRQQLLSNMKKTSYVARREFYRGLYGQHHPLGAAATLTDVDSLTVGDIRSFHRQRYLLGTAYAILSGNVDEHVVKVFDSVFGSAIGAGAAETTMPMPEPEQASGMLSRSIDGAVQNTLRIGRVLPFAWNSTDYAAFMVLATVLGGYFGSRLMSNLREDKGYTYGIQASTMMFKDSLSFFIVSDVASDKAEAAIGEIRNEIDVLRREPISQDELFAVRNCMLGDFMRSIDGVFERCERFKQMHDTSVTELFTDNFMNVLNDLSSDAMAERLMEMAKTVMAESDLLFVNVGRI